MKIWLDFFKFHIYYLFYNSVQLFYARKTLQQNLWKKNGQFEKNMVFFKVCSFIKYFGIRYTNKKDAQHEYYGKD